MIYFSYTDILEKDQKYKEIERLTRILELIAIVKTRIMDELQFCKNIYGTNKYGQIVCQQKNIDKINHHRLVMERLQRYYNNKSKLSEFI